MENGIVYGVTENGVLDQVATNTVVAVENLGGDFAGIESWNIGLAQEMFSDKGVTLALLAVAGALFAILAGAIVSSKFRRNLFRSTAWIPALIAIALVSAPTSSSTIWGFFDGAPFAVQGGVSAGVGMLVMVGVMLINTGYFWLGFPFSAYSIVTSIVALHAAVGFGTLTALMAEQQINTHEDKVELIKELAKESTGTQGNVSQALASATSARDAAVARLNQIQTQLSGGTAVEQRPAALAALEAELAQLEVYRECEVSGPVGCTSINLIDGHVEYGRLHQVRVPGPGDYSSAIVKKKREVSNKIAQIDNEYQQRLARLSGSNEELIAEREAIQKEVAATGQEVARLTEALAGSASDTKQAIEKLESAYEVNNVAWSLVVIPALQDMFMKEGRFYCDPEVDQVTAEECDVRKELHLREWGKVSLAIITVLAILFEMCGGLPGLMNAYRRWRDGETSLKWPGLHALIPSKSYLLTGERVPHLYVDENGNPLKGPAPRVTVVTTDDLTARAIENHRKGRSRSQGGDVTKTIADRLSITAGVNRLTGRGGTTTTAGGERTEEGGGPSSQAATASTEEKLEAAIKDAHAETDPKELSKKIRKAQAIMAEMGEDEREAAFVNAASAVAMAAHEAANASPEGVDPTSREASFVANAEGIKKAIRENASDPEAAQAEIDHVDTVVASLTGQEDGESVVDYEDGDPWFDGEPDPELDELENELDFELEDVDGEDAGPVLVVNNDAAGGEDDGDDDPSGGPGGGNRRKFTPFPPFASEDPTDDQRAERAEDVATEASLDVSAMAEELAEQQRIIEDLRMQLQERELRADGDHEDDLIDVNGDSDSSVSVGGVRLNQIDARNIAIAPDFDPAASWARRHQNRNHKDRAPTLAVSRGGQPMANANLIRLMEQLEGAKSRRSKSMTLGNRLAALIDDKTRELLFSSQGEALAAAHEALNMERIEDAAAAIQRRIREKSDEQYLVEEGEDK